MDRKGIGGVPPRYKTVEDMQKKIDEYFKDCEGRILKIDGKPVLDKHDEPIYVDKRPLTVTGLALALGFTSRQALINYQAKPEFVDTITRANSKIEQYAEERLFDRDGVNGSKFTLACNFGWREKEEEQAKEMTVKIEGDLSKWAK